MSTRSVLTIDRDRGAALGVNPLPIDEPLIPDQRSVFETELHKNEGELKLNE